jgi:hypothetical protein
MNVCRYHGIGGLIQVVFILDLLLESSIEA